MQPFVESVFVVVVSVIATLLVSGLTGIIILLAIDPATAPHLPGHRRAVDDGGGLQNPRGSSPGLTHSAVLRTSP